MLAGGNNREDPCDVLGIPRESTIDEARRARKELARKAHPDSPDYDPRNADLLKRVNAYFVEWEQCKRDGKTFLLESNFESEEDPFADIEEKKNAKRSASQNKYLPKNGEDIRIRREIDLEKALIQGQVQIKVTAELRNSMFTDKANITVKIPPTFSSGKTIKMKGRGKPGLFGGNPGDLYITLVSKKKEPAFVTPPPQPTPTIKPTYADDLYEKPPIRLSEVTPVENIGNQIWWKLALAAMSAFLLLNLFNRSETQTQPPEVNYPIVNENDATDWTEEDPTISEDSEIDPYADESDSGATGELETVPEASPSDDSSSDGGSGATGTLGNP